MLTSELYQYLCMFSVALVLLYSCSAPRTRKKEGAGACASSFYIHYTIPYGIVFFFLFFFFLSFFSHSFSCHPYIFHAIRHDVKSILGHHCTGANCSAHITSHTYTRQHHMDRKSDWETKMGFINSGVFPLSRTAHLLYLHFWVVDLGRGGGGIHMPEHGVTIRVCVVG